MAYLRYFLFLLVLLFSCQDQAGCSPYLFHETLNKPLKWSKLPVPTCLEVGPAYMASSLKVIEAWNSRKQYFRVVRKNAKITVRISTRSCTEEQGIARFNYHKAIPRLTRCDISICKTLPLNEYRTVLAHELGHCLGLAHDRIWSSSIMWSTYRPGQFWRPSRRDFKNLSALYEKKGGL